MKKSKKRKKKNKNNNNRLIDKFYVKPIIEYTTDEELDYCGKVDSAIIGRRMCCGD